MIREKHKVDKVNKTLIGLVLAGGQSRRMGQDKALMRYQGSTLIERASSLLKAAGCDEVLISRNAPNFLNDKIDTMKIYESEIGDHPLPRSEKSIRALGALRGSQSGFEAAEAFELVYELK